MKKNGVLILDYGSQYTKLIARRVREENIYSQIVSHDISLDDVLDQKAIRKCIVKLYYTGWYVNSHILYFNKNCTVFIIHGLKYVTDI